MPSPQPPDAAFPDAASELVATLADEGVQHLFINPGTDTAPVQEALAAARVGSLPAPRTVLCTHEFVALSAAVGHYFASGTPQAVMVHVDAGTLNLGGAVHNAQRNQVPVVVFAGRAPYATEADVPGHRDRPIHWQQEQADQQATLRAYGKWAMEVPRGREMGRIVRRAFQVARSEPRGLGYVMLPREALMEPPGAASRRLTVPRPAAPDPPGLADPPRCRADAPRPVVVTGRTGARPEAVTALAELAELLGCPVLDQRDRFNFPPGHPLWAAGETALLREAGVVLVLDAEVPWIPAVGAPPPTATVLQIDLDCVKVTMPSWAYPVDLALTADSSLALPLLTAELRELAGRLDRLRERWAEAARSAEPADAADAMLAALNRALPPEAIVCEEAVTNRPAVTRQITRDPDHLYSSGAPSLGWALPGAMGVRLARPDAPVVAVCGDGSFNFSVPTAAIWSAQRAGAPFLAVILDNRAYRASRLPVQQLFPAGAAEAEGRFPETDLSPAPDYLQLARAYGGDGEVVRDPKEMAGAVERGLALVETGRCAVLDVELPRPGS